jgi:hypothetical protein
MADQDDGPRRLRYTADDAVDLILMVLQTVVAGEHLLPLRPERRDQLAEARTLGPDSMGEDDAFVPRHNSLLSQSGFVPRCGNGFADQF